ncbi:MAG TPA: hypothetical protein PK074_12895 [Spirochaetales bacterium]|nr:hypothetical protein [Spirochaetales bacterium]
MSRIDHSKQLDQSQIDEIKKEISKISNSVLLGKPYSKVTFVNLPISQETQDNLYINSLISKIEEQKKQIEYLADEIDRLTLSDRINKALKNIEQNRL